MPASDNAVPSPTKQHSTQQQLLWPKLHSPCPRFRVKAQTDQPRRPVLLPGLGDQVADHRRGPRRDETAVQPRGHTRGPAHLPDRPHYPRELDVLTDKANISWQYPQAQALFRALAKDQEVDKDELTAAEPVPARTITVRVFNATGTPGRAATAAKELRAAGYTVTGTDNAPTPAKETT
ncbi:LytR C-terminal domain-containing protein [Streptomyces viridosporus]|uniref:LytR C-terminal domain-containing protein n=1 Tax=Streptomyces viridosporus TaxID=67581 RepID=UPI0031343CC4